MFRKFIIMFCFLGLIIHSACLKKSDTKVSENLQAFTKMYGYIRFFHPSDEASSIDWDKFAVYGVSKVKQAKTQTELLSILKELFYPIAPTVQIYKKGEIPEPFIEPKNTNELFPVFWQHKGVGLNKDSVYKSRRINKFRQIDEDDLNDYLLQDIDVKLFKGKYYKLKVKSINKGEGKSAKLVAKGYVGDDRTYIKEINLTRNSGDTYSIEDKFPENIESFYVGVEVLDNCKLILDDFELYNSKDRKDWNQVDMMNSDFEDKSEKDSISGWYTEKSITDFSLNTNEQINGKCSLEINSIEGSIKGSLFIESLKPGEIVQKDIGSGLMSQIPIALWGSKEKTFGENKEYPFNLLFEKLKNISLENRTANEEDIRFAGIVIFWNVIQHFYPYFDVVKVDFGKVLSDTFQEALTIDNEKDFIVLLRRMMAKLQDGHMNCYIKGKPKKCLPFICELIENKVVITKTQDSENYPLGDIIVEINGMDAIKYYKNEMSLISGTKQWKRNIAPFGILVGEINSTVKLKIIKDKEEVEKIAIRNSLYKNFKNKSDKKIVKINKDIFYVNLNITPMDEIEKRIEELSVSRGVIFDLRKYPKGNDDILRYLTDKPIMSAKWYKPLILYPDQDKLVGYDTSGRWKMSPLKPRFKGKVVFLTSGRCISYGESVMGIVEAYGLGTIIGETTAGTNGNINPMTLPGNIRVSWTGMKVLKHDNSVHHLVGIKPNIPVHRTIKGIKEGRDEYLEKAIQFLTKNIKNDL